MLALNTIINADCLAGLKTLPDNSVDCCVTSPPYFGLRDYGVDGQIGLEKTPAEYIARLVEVFEQVRRVLKPEGTLWLNIGDSYAGSGRGKGYVQRHCGLDPQPPVKTVKQPAASRVGNIANTQGLDGYKPKDLIGIPFMLAFALRDAGWYLRQDIIWNKTNPMPESVTDRCVKSHEYIFLLSKSKNYYFDSRAIEEVAAYDGRHNLQRNAAGKYQNGYTGLQKQGFAVKTTERWRTNQYGDFIRSKRDVWSIATQPLHEDHFASFPQELVKNCILAGSAENGVVLDPFVGSGTVAVVARKLNRNYIGIELNPKYCAICGLRLRKAMGLFL